MKKKDPNKSAIVMKVDPFVLVLDPNALTRESLWIRLYKEVNPLIGSITEAYSLQVAELLHEVDGPLDNENRKKFISILENQIERIGSEQNFLITHNDMFANYPVDIIDLSWDDSSHKNYELANFIPVIRD